MKNCNSIASSNIIVSLVALLLLANGAPLRAENPAPSAQNPSLSPHSCAVSETNPATATQYLAAPAIFYQSSTHSIQRARALIP